MPTRADQKPSRRGLAMLLVVFAATMLFALTLGFCSRAILTVHVADNLRRQAQARSIADSGMRMALAYATTSEAYRTERVPGDWVKDQPFGGGTFTVNGVDGEDTNGDGIVESTGSFVDNPKSLLTLTVTASVGEARSVARATVFPPKKVLLVVTDPLALTAEASLRRDALANWGWSVSLIKASSTAAQLQAALSNVNVVYVPAYVTLSSAMQTTLKGTKTAVVSEHKSLPKQLVITGSDSSAYNASTISILPLTVSYYDDSDHLVTVNCSNYITAPYPVGTLTVSAATKLLKHADHYAPGALMLAGTNDVNKPSLLVLDSGGLKRDKKPSLGPRVVLPWGESGADKFAFAALNTTGLDILRRSLDWAGGGWSGPVPGVSVWDKIEIKDRTFVDGYSSSAGPYGGANVSGRITVGTNSINDDAIHVDGTIMGSAYVTSGANLKKVVTVKELGRMTGTVYQTQSTIPIPMPVLPSVRPGSEGDLTIKVGTTIISGSRSFNHLTIGESAIVQISGSVTLFVAEDLQMSKNAVITLLPGADLTMYCSHNITLKNNARFTTSSDVQSVNLIMIKGNIELDNTSQLSALVSSYGSELRVQDDAQFFGTFVGRKLRTEHNGQVHLDTDSSGTETTIGNGTDLRRVTVKRYMWVAPPPVR